MRRGTALQGRCHQVVRQFCKCAGPGGGVVLQVGVAKLGVQMHAALRLRWQWAATTDPKRINGLWSLGVQSVCVEQHLHFILQTTQQALGRGLF